LISIKRSRLVPAAALTEDLRLPGSCGVETRVIPCSTLVKKLSTTDDAATQMASINALLPGFMQKETLTAGKFFLKDLFHCLPFSG
jgi:hypothetical protein